jgi:3-oxoacyl-[acyl-carrier-protein] synthase II
MLACHIGIIHDIQGPSNSITCGESSAYLAIAEAAQVIDRGCADIALAGGCEAKVNPIVMIRQCLLKRATSQGNDDPKKACRPFDADAAGAVFGEGAGIVILEELEHAKNRGAKIYAELIGTGASNSLNTAYEHLESDGRGVQIAIEQAMTEAGIGADDIDLIIPCGTGIAQDDDAEATGIANALGPAVENIPALPIKSLMSHTGAAAGALDTIAALMAMQQEKIPAAANCDNKAQGCKLNVSTKEQQKSIRHALCCGYSFGGQTAALVFKNYEGRVND